MMELIPVRFTYLTGIRDELFHNVRLHGSWDAEGKYSTEWSTVPMVTIKGEDGCPAYSVLVRLAADQLNWWFHWGILLDGPSGRDHWGIMTETKDAYSRERRRSFQLRAARDDQPQEVYYYLNASRRLGAQKHYHAETPEPGIRFSVWAPHARQVQHYGLCV